MQMMQEVVGWCIRLQHTALLRLRDKVPNDSSSCRSNTACRFHPLLVLQVEARESQAGASEKGQALSGLADVGADFL
jgi:hypothetical protein